MPTSILFLAYWYPHKYNRQFCTYMQEHARAIHTAGNTVKVLAVHFLGSKNLFRKYVEIETDSFGFEVHHLYIESILYRWIHINPWHCYWLTGKYVRKMFRVVKPTIIHSNIVGVCAISGHFIAKKYGLKHVITEHWTRVDKYMRNNKLSFLGRKAYNGADRITVVSSFLGNIVKKYVKDPSKITRVANVIDPATFYYAPKTPSPNKLVFCSIGHLKLPKLPLLMVKGLQVVAQSTEKEVEFYMFGKGPQQKEIEELMPNLGYKIHLMGLKPKTELAETLRKSVFYLHASSYETFCVAIAEALCTGTPVIASNNTAIPELIHEGNGLLTQDTVEEWGKALLKALELPFHHDQIAQETETKYTYLSIGTEFNKVYTSCMYPTDPS